MDILPDLLKQHLEQQTRLERQAKRRAKWDEFLSLFKAHTRYFWRVLIRAVLIALCLVATAFLVECRLSRAQGFDLGNPRDAPMESGKIETRYVSVRNRAEFLPIILIVPIVPTPEENKKIKEIQEAMEKVGIRSTTGGYLPLDPGECEVRVEGSGYRYSCTFYKKKPKNRVTITLTQGSEVIASIREMTRLAREEYKKMGYHQEI